MYRKRTYGSHKYNTVAAAAALERKRMDAPAPDYPLPLPDLRRRIVIEDFDYGETVRHEIELYKSNRIDSYFVVVDGKQLSGRIGWARVLEKIRKAFIRASNFCE